MIKNVSDETLILKWNAREVVLAPKASIDIAREFNVQGKEAAFIEDRYICDKFPGKVVRVVMNPVIQEDASTEEPVKKAKAKK